MMLRGRPGKPGVLGLLRKPSLVILSAAKNLRDDDSAGVGRPFTSFSVTRAGFLDGLVFGGFYIWGRGATAGGLTAAATAAARPRDG
jgi:hypothetical protein